MTCGKPCAIYTVKSMPDNSPEKLQEIVNIALRDLSGPLDLMYGWIDLLAEAHKDQDEELLQMCIEHLQSSSKNVMTLWQMMHDLYFNEAE